jgi:hypothetical protein
MALPFALVRSGDTTIPLLLGDSGPGGNLIGLDVADLRVFELAPEDIDGAVSIDPAGVYYGMEASARVASVRRAADTVPYEGNVPWDASVHHLATQFFANTEGNEEDLEPFVEDPRTHKIARVLQSALGIFQIRKILGAGSFGTAALIDTPEGERVLKLTSDGSEVQAGAVLMGQDLSHVAKVYGSYFISGVRVNAITGWDRKNDEYLRAPTKVGVVVLEKVRALGRDDKLATQLNYIIRDLKTVHEGYPEHLYRMGKKKAREHLRNLSELLVVELERWAARARVPSVQARLPADVIEYVRQGLYDIAAAIEELREREIYAIDAHGGNVGQDMATGAFKLFDIGSSSPPDVPKAQTIAPKKRPRRTRAVRGPGWEQMYLPLAPDVEVREIDEASEGVGLGKVRPVPRYAPRGYKFRPLEHGSELWTGFPVVRKVLERHRAEVPSIDTVRLSGVFAVSTVRTSIEQAERSFDCFVELYEKRGSKDFPDVEAIKRCFRGLQNSKSQMFREVAGYAETIREAMGRGLRDRELRRHLSTETRLPRGLGLAKLSFTLALLGQDTVCLDARLMVRMFGTREKATGVEQGWGKTEQGRVSELGLKRYEKVEDAFLSGNPLYDPADPIGRARAQWQSWESVGGEPATHAVWLRVVA